MIVSRMLLKLKLKKDTVIKNDLNYFLYSSIFKLLKSQFEEFTTNLKSMDFKPFTISPLRGNFKIDGENILLYSGYYNFEITCIGEKISRIFYAILCKAVVEKMKLTLGGAEFDFVSIIPSGRNSNQKYGVKILKRGKIYNKIKFSFISPTAFRRKRINYLFPEPYTVFSSIYRRYLKFGGKEFRNITEKNLSDLIVVSKYNIKKAVFSVKGDIVRGFVG